MPNFDIITAYDPNGLAGQLGEWFSELVPGITISQDIWEQMAPKIIHHMNCNMLSLQIKRGDFSGVLETQPEKTTSAVEEPVGIPMPVAANIETVPVDHETVQLKNTTYPEDTVALMVSNGMVYPYKSLQHAIEGVKDEHAYIVLLQDVVLPTMLRIDKKIKIDLNNREIRCKEGNYAIWTKSDAVFSNGLISCEKSSKAVLYVSSTLVAANLVLRGSNGIQLASSSAGPAMLETHNLTLIDGSDAILMTADGNIVNVYNDGVTCNGKVVTSNATEINNYVHKVFFHTEDGILKSDYPYQKFSGNVNVTFL